MLDNKSAHNSDLYDDRIISVLPYYREYHARIISLLIVCILLFTACGSGEKQEVSFSDIENMAENAVFNVNWTTMDGNYTSGSNTPRTV